MKYPKSGRTPTMSTNRDHEWWGGGRQKKSDGYCEERECEPSMETSMKTDIEIRRDVESELQWDPSVDDKKIGVIVNDGVVTLTGEVCHFGGKWAAEDITKRVSGVRAIANEIHVRIPLAGARSDTDIA